MISHCSKNDNIRVQIGSLEASLSLLGLDKGIVSAIRQQNRRRHSFLQLLSPGNTGTTHSKGKRALVMEEAQKAERKRDRNEVKQE